MYHGMSNSMENLFRLSNAQSRSISPENYTGAKGGGAMCELENGNARSAARDLGKGWKVKAWMKPIFRYLVPAAIIFIYIYGMVTFGWK